MKKLIILVSLALVFGACKKEKETKTENSTELSGTIKVDGSSTVFPVTEAVAEEFRAVQPKVKVTIGVSGTGGGFQKILKRRNESF